ncbi:hypothetical protein [Candidatus Poriferisodalis sp.]|uniref:hypothetical protein n=1 Tax=Candidatus Poriferisodalis sp. TaxID=3101277 RepID=UPI003B5A9B96
MTTHEFCLFVDGADLTVASTVERLEGAGYSRPAAAAHDGVQALVFSRQSEHLVDAVGAVVTAAEGIPGLCVAREARSGAVPVFDPASLRLTTACTVAEPTSPAGAAPNGSRCAHLESSGVDVGSRRYG